MWKVPKELETALLSYLKKRYLPERKINPKTANEFTHYDIRFFAAGAADMSAYFTTERDILPKNYLNKKELRAGYILYFVMTNFLKAKFCLDKINALNRFKDRDIVRIADVGCGPGTVSFACADIWRGSGQKVEITAVDQNTHALHDAKHIFNAFAPPNVDLRTVFSHIHPKGVSRALKGKYDIIVAANFLSEIGDIRKQEDIVLALLSGHLNEEGVIVIIEPALRATSRDLMRLRDLLAAGPDPRADVLAPCLHKDPCPMLIESDRDWCHMYMDWKRPDVVEKVDAYVGNRKDYLKFSYLILSKKTVHGSRVTGHASLWRAVSAPMPTKGKCELVLCGGGKLFRVVRLDKNASPLNSDFDRITRGDLVEYHGGPGIEKTSIFKIV